MAVIKRAFKQSINIVFCSNHYYLPYLGVVLNSLINHASPKYNYDILILYNQKKHHYRIPLKHFCRCNISVRQVDYNLKNLAPKAKFFTHRYYVPEVYARFFIPQILTAYRKVLYLDIDMLILDDVAKLYHFDLGDKSLAASRDFVSLVDVGFFTKLFTFYLHHDLGLKHRRDYFCSGVMLMDLTKLRQEKFTQRCLAQLLKITSPLYVDQDILNCLYAGQLKYFHQRWNIMTLCFDRQIIKQVKKTSLINQQQLLAYWQLMSNPGAIHFSGGVKPWLKKSAPFAAWWWQTAKYSPFFVQIMGRKLKQHLNYLSKHLLLLINKLKEKVKHFFLGMYAICRFVFLKNRQQTILLIEGNTFHGEIIHSLALYYRQLNYRVVLLLNPVLLSEQLDKVLPADQQVTVLVARAFYLRFMLNYFNLAKFKLVIFNSREIACGKQNQHYQQYFALKNNWRAWCIRHHLQDNLSHNLPEQSLVLLKNPQFPERNLSLINYGQAIIKPLGKKIVLAVIGSIAPERKNFSLLLQVVAELLQQGQNNFVIMLIGSSQPVGLSPRLAPYFSFHNRVSYPCLYQLITQSDFILSLLDPEVKAHREYRCHRCTGSANFSFAFLKPFIVEQSFAPAYGFNGDNSLLYRGNQQLTATISKALKMSAAQYQRLGENLQKDARHLQKRTLAILKQLAKNA